MDLITVVVFCNCTIAIGCILLTLLTVRLRQQLAAIARYCDRWSNDCDWRSTIAPDAILDCREQIRHLRQTYQQQTIAINSAKQSFHQRVWAMGLLIQITRSLLKPTA